MSNTTLNWSIRKALAKLKESGRLNVLVCYITHQNVRGRSFPSVDVICDETDFESAAVVAAKKWLVKTGALERVKFRDRVGNERELHPRIDVMQITGFITIDGETVPYLYFNEYENVNISPTEVSPTKISVGETEVVVKDSSEDIAILPEDSVAPVEQPARTKGKKERDPNLDHPAFLAWDCHRDSGSNKLAANAEQRKAIVETVGDSLDAWNEVIEAWLLKGYRLINISGLLDWFVSWRQVSFSAQQKPWVYRSIHPVPVQSKNSGAPTQEQVEAHRRFMEQQRAAKAQHGDDSNGTA